jgi:hypothetical protein
MNNEQCVMNNEQVKRDLAHILLVEGGSDK